MLRRIQMAASLRQSVSVCQRCLQIIQTNSGVTPQRFISTTGVLWRNIKWKEREDLARSMEYGPLTDLPDWSYVDGRKAPLRRGQLKRIEEQREIAERIDLLAGEMMKAVEDHQNKVQSEEDKRIETIAIKLKAKGSKHRKREKLHRVIP